MIHYSLSSTHVQRPEILSWIQSFLLPCPILPFHVARHRNNHKYTISPLLSSVLPESRTHILELSLLPVHLNVSAIIFPMLSSQTHCSPALCSVSRYKPESYCINRLQFPDSYCEVPFYVQTYSFVLLH